MMLVDDGSRNICGLSRVTSVGCIINSCIYCPNTKLASLISLTISRLTSSGTLKTLLLPGLLMPLKAFLLFSVTI